MAILSPELQNEIIALANELAVRFAQPEFIPGCQVKDITDISLYATNNGWVEAVCGQHNQQRVRWKSSDAVAVNNYIDVMYFADRRVFEAWGVGGSTAVGGVAETIKVSADDTTPGYLEDKIASGSAGISVSTSAPGGDELFQISGTVATEVSQGMSRRATQAEVNAGEQEFAYVSPLTLHGKITGLIKVSNTSGASASAGDVGYINYAGEYKTTTTAQATINWCVVITGGANFADIYVVRRGRVTVNYTGTAPSAGHYLVTSTTGGSAQRQTTMHPAVFAVCAAAGSGGTVEAVLLTGRSTVPFTSSNNLLQMTSVSLSDFVATQNGAPSGATITYNAPSSGNENTINPAATTELGKIIIHNTTRGTSAQLQATNTGTNVMTFTAAADVSGWQNGDTLTARSQTNTDTISSSYFYDVAIDTGFAEVDGLAVGFIPYTLLLDNAAAKNFRYHSYEAGAAAKRNTFNTQVASVNFIFTAPPVPIINRRYCVNWEANGAGTMTFTTRIFALIIATP